LNFVQITLIGNVGRDPDLSYTPDGVAVTRFSLAVNKKEGKDGQAKEKTTWYACTAFRALAEAIVEHVRKGDPLFVQGEFNPRGYTDKEGIPRTSLDVLVEKFQLLSSKPPATQEAVSAPA
jgi:single-strand DNA-binding protein